MQGVIRQPGMQRASTRVAISGSRGGHQASAVRTIDAINANTNQSGATAITGKLQPLHKQAKKV
jgi:hypothetical protein